LFIMLSVICDTKNAEDDKQTAQHNLQ